MRQLLLTIALATLAAGWASATEMDFYAGEAAPYLVARAVGMAPLAPLATWLDATVTEDGGAMQVALGTRAVRFMPGSCQAEYRRRGRARSVSLPAAAVRRDGQVYVPLRGLIDGLRLASAWDARWLQVTLYHPVRPRGLVLALADPASFETPPVRGTNVIGGLVPPALMFPLFDLSHGALEQHNQGRPLPGHATAVKCYSLTRYLGAGRWRALPRGDYAISPRLPAGTAFCISGEWNAMPRPPRRENPADPRNQARVRALLAAGNAEALPVTIDQGYRIDLNGDGRDVVLLSGTYVTKYDEHHSPVGAYYSFAGIWDAAEDKKPLDILWQYFPNRDYIYGRHSIGGILDANADGRMEVMLNDDSSWTGRAIYARTADGMIKIASAEWGE